MAWRTVAPGSKIPHFPGAMTEFFCVFGQAVGNKSNPKNNQPKHENTEYEANPEECKIIKVNAGSVAEAQMGIRHFFGGDVTNTPIVVTKGEWEKESGGGTTNYFVVFTQQNMGRRYSLTGNTTPLSSTFESFEILEDPFEGNFIKIKAEGQNEAKVAIMRHFAGDITTTVRAVTEAQWKSS